MTNEERDLIARFVARVGGAPQSGGFLGGSGSVPSSPQGGQPQLPPIDKEADDFIGQQFGKYPEAKYRMTQTAMVQEAALEQAQRVIQDLQAQLQQARSQAQQGQSQSQGGKGGGFLSSIFGGGQSQQPAQQPQPQRPAGPWGGQQAPQGGYAPQPQYGQPQYGQPQAPGGGMFGRGGSGFLGSALTTAAGVAGGMVVGNALMNAFSGHGGGWGSSAAANTIGDSSGFGGAGTDFGGPMDSGASFSDPFGAGGDAKDAGGGGFDNNASYADPFGGSGNDGNAGFDQGGFGGDFGGGGGDFGGGGFDENT